jgi:hypothetical protein
MEVRNQLHIPVALTQGKHLPESRSGLHAFAKTICLNQQGTAVFESTGSLSAGWANPAYSFINAAACRKVYPKEIQAQMFSGLHRNSDTGHVASSCRPVAHVCLQCRLHRQMYVEWSTLIFPGVKAGGAWGWQPQHFHVPNVMKSGNLNLLDPSGPHRACYGTPLPLLYYIICRLPIVWRISRSLLS